MLTSTSCTTGGVLCTTLAHMHKSMESRYIRMRTHNLPLFCLTFGVILRIEGVSKCESSVWICALPHFCILCEVYTHIQILLVAGRDSHFDPSCTLQCTVVLPRQLTTPSLEAFSVCIAMASLRVYCLLLLMHLLNVLDICEVQPILAASCVYKRSCVHEAVLYFWITNKQTICPPSLVWYAKRFVHLLVHVWLHEFCLGKPQPEATVVPYTTVFVQCTQFSHLTCPLFLHE